MKIIDSKEFRKLYRVICFVLFSVYMMVLINLLFFDIRYGRVTGIKGCNLVPFKTIRNYIINRKYVNDSVVITNILGNIFAFIPFGFFVPTLFIKTRCFIKVILISGLLSLLVELMQYKFAVGTFDVDDIILNTIGGFVGYIVFKICFNIYYKLLHKE
ncbi:MAG: VanZ family protein [Vallitalea sp.]|jgi:glycopeptide antibiotics resistance protein|nr:VanZ family protein [Vallitalea sp.]